MFRKSRLIALTILLALIASTILPAYAEGPTTPPALLFSDGSRHTVQDLLDLNNMSADTPLQMAGTMGRKPTGIASVELPGSVYVPAPEIVDAMPVVGGVFPPDARYWVKMHWTQNMDDWGGPNDSVAYLDIFWTNGDRSNCTGWVTGLKVIVTSGHCLYQVNRGGFAETVTAYVGLNGPFIPFFGKGTKPVVNSILLSVPDAWATMQDYNADYGAIIVEDVLLSGVPVPIGELVGGFGFRTNKDSMTDIRMWPFDPRTPNQWYQGKFWTLGYPNINFQPGPEQIWPGEQYKTHNDKAIWATASNSLLYYLDTGDGWGGAPIYQDWQHWEDLGYKKDFMTGDCWGRPGGQCFPTVVAIHQGRSIDECWDPADPTIVGPCVRWGNETANRAIRITKDVSNALFAWLAISNNY